MMVGQRAIDYANQRYYTATAGRFWTPDPYQAGPDGWDLSEPGSWNRYAYVGGDPINYDDPEGLFRSAHGPGLTNNPNPPGPANPNPFPSRGTGGKEPIKQPNPDPGRIGGGAKTPIDKSYNIDTQCQKSASGVMSDVENNFASFGNYTGSFDGLSTTLTFDVPSGGISPGAVVQIPHSTLGITLNDSVTVTQADSTSFTFTTNPGHPLNATISFTAQGMGNGFLGFTIKIDGTVSNILWSAFFAAGGSAFEDNVWNHFLDQITADCAKP